MRFVGAGGGRGGGGGGGGGLRGKGVSVVMLPVQRKSLYTSLTGMKCMFEGSLFVSAVEWSSLCNTF